MKKEGFQPISNTPPVGFAGKLKYYGRMMFDLQILTIVRDIKPLMALYRGKVLDVGCGESPYRMYLDATKTEYFGIDIAGATDFGYRNPDVTFFDGKNIPFENETFSAVVCTEVLEHVHDYQYLVNEIYRTSKPGADIIVTIPWSARYHYIPYDYFRYTPSTLKAMFENFSDVVIRSRGSDLTVIGSKLIVLFFRGFFPANKWKYFLLPLYILFSPVLILFIIMAHLSLWLGLGSSDDPLGYTIILKR
ncbi:MAG: class I SAM-dependent methyltransferase [Chitinophagaceae bacterium]